VRHHYAPVAHSCPTVRADLRAFLSTYRFDDQLVQDTVQVANELAANAVAHARTTFSVTLTLIGGMLRLEVADGSAQPPCLQPRQPPTDRGHGLRIVDALTTAWSVTPTGTGKIVRADLAIR